MIREIGMSALGVSLALVFGAVHAEGNESQGETLRFLTVGRIEGEDFHDISVEGDHAFLTHERDALIAYDLSDPSRPRELGRATARDGGRGLAIDGSLALVLNEPGGSTLVDIGDPASPRIVGRMSSGDPDGAIAFRDGVAYLADGKDLLLLDLKTPAMPQGLVRVEMDFFGPPEVALSESFAFVPQRPLGVDARRLEAVLTEVWRMMIGIRSG